MTGNRYIVLQPVTFSYNTGKTLPIMSHQDGVVSGEPFITIDISEFQPDNDPYGCLISGLTIYMDAPHAGSNHPLIANRDFYKKEGMDELYINYVDYDLWDMGYSYQEVPAKIYQLGTIIYDGLVFYDYDGGNFIIYDDDINAKYTFQIPRDPSINIKATNNTRDVDETPTMILEKVPGVPPLLGDITLPRSKFPGGSLPMASIISITQTISGIKFAKKIKYEAFKYPN